PIAAHAEAAMNDFLEVITARQTADVLATHRTHDVAAQQHRRELADLIYVVALLPPSNSSPRDLRRRVEQVERIGGDTAPTELMRRDAEVAQLQLFVLAYENVERREIAMQP